MQIPRFLLIFFRKFYCFRWIDNNNQPLNEKVILHITSIDLYDLLKFRMPINDQSSASFIPCALQIKGIINNKIDMRMDGRIGYFLISDIDFEKKEIPLKVEDRIELSLAQNGRCFKFEKI